MTDDSREPQANIAPFGLRMQSPLKDAIATAAKANNRSMNAEIVARLQYTLELDAGSRGTVVAIPEDLLSELKHDARSGKVPLDQEIVDRLKLTYRFDAEFGWAGQLKEEMGPVGALIDQRLRGLEDQIEKLRTALTGEIFDMLVDKKPRE